jgi:hypothetical protein
MEAWWELVTTTSAEKCGGTEKPLTKEMGMETDRYEVYHGVGRYDLNATFECRATDYAHAVKKWLATEPLLPCEAWLHISVKHVASQTTKLFRVHPTFSAKFEEIDGTFENKQQVKQLPLVVTRCNDCPFFTYVGRSVNTDEHTYCCSRLPPAPIPSKKRPPAEDVVIPHNCPLNNA